MLVQSLSGEEKSISQSKVKGIMSSVQVWHCLIPVFAAFWAFFAFLLLTYNLLFFVVLATLTPLSGLVVYLAWAFQNNI